MPERENGFYWVNRGGTWIVAEFVDSVWFIPEIAFDEDLDFINETRLLPPMAEGMKEE